MIINFEEKDRSIIESKGIMIIEFKHKLYNMKKATEDIYHIWVEIKNKVANEWKVFVKNFLEAVDSLELVSEQIKESFHYPTSRRYKIAKVFSKCIGTNILFGWRITWKIKRGMAWSYTGMLTLI